MSQASDYLEAALLDHMMGITPYVKPATMYLAKYTAAPTDAGGGTEVAGGSYTRIAITNDSGEWVRSGQTVRNINIIPFAPASAGWGDLSHWALHDHPTAGNMLIRGALTDVIPVTLGATYRVAATQLAITFAFRSNYLSAAMLDHVFGLEDYVAPTNVDIALFTSNPTDAGGGTEVTDVGTDYDRLVVANGAATWTRTLNQVANDIDFAWDPAAAPYGTVQGQAAFESGTENLMWWKALTVPQAIGLGSAFAFSPGQYRVTLD